MFWCPCLSMYITVTGIQNREPVSLTNTLSACASAEIEVALCELTYYHRWYNISSDNKNNEVVNGEHVTQIPDGHYNVCELNEDFGCRTPSAYTNWLLTDVCKKTSGLKQRAGQTLWVCSRRIRTRQNIHCGRATQACYLSGDLHAPCWDKHFRQSTQRSPLHTA